jgi:alpha-L-fucosidase 2
MTMSTRLLLPVILLGLFAGGEMRARTLPAGVSQTTGYNIVWDSPSKDCAGSMPLGNGDIGVNAWVEESGDLLFYIGKTDSWDDNGRLLKVGRVRIQLNPRPTAPLKDFKQTLSLLDGTMNVRFRIGDNTVDIRLWVDAHHPVINVDMESTQDIGAVASTEIWRTGKDTLQSIEVSDTYCDINDVKRGTTVVEPDEVLAQPAIGIGWYHHNIKSVGPAISARLQGVQEFPRADPLLDRTFGAVVIASNAAPLDPRHLSSLPSMHHQFSIYVVTRHPATPDQWRRAVEGVVAETEASSRANRREAHVRWWNEFWSRSWIHVKHSGGSAGKGDDDAFVVSRAYALQRYIAACAGRGGFPIKFNGSLFTVPAAGKPGDADYRRWGSGYWWQNTRLPYTSMCASGDVDLMQPLFRMYARDLMPLFRYRTRLYMNHGGAYIPECIFFWGDVFNETYGWTPFEQRVDKLQESGWHKWEWVSGLELVHLMLEYFDHTLDREFLRNTLLPVAHEILTFFDEHYPVDASGKLVMHPSQACETWWECTNPMPEVAGLHAVLGRLGQLPGGLTTAVQRRFWLSLQKKVPGLPTRTVGGSTMLAPAMKFAQKRNVENPELYAVYPFRLVAFEKENVALGIEALKRREDSGNFGWRQDDIFMAYLGLADSTRHYLVGRAMNSDSSSRFPAFWGPNYDWVPDQDHGSVLLKTLQSMILQTEGRKCFVVPAWPKGWDVEFKLHAPFETTIEGKVENGKIVRLVTVPASRRADVTLVNPQ